MTYSQINGTEFIHTLFCAVLLCKDHIVTYNIHIINAVTCKRVDCVTYKINCQV